MTRGCSGGNAASAPITRSAEAAAPGPTPWRETTWNPTRAVFFTPMAADHEGARHVADRVVLRTKDVRQAVQVAKLCGTPEEVDRQVLVKQNAHC